MADSIHAAKNTRFNNEAMKVTVAQILRGVCDNPDIPAEKVPEIFIGRITNVLLTIREVSPSYAEKIYLITSALLRCGFEVARNRNLDLLNFDQSNLHEGSLIGKITQLFELEKKMKILMEEKQNLFQSLFHTLNSFNSTNFTSPSHSASVCVTTCLEDKAKNYNENGTKNPISKKDFSPSTIFKAAALSDKQLSIIKTEKCEEDMQTSSISNNVSLNHSNLQATPSKIKSNEFSNRVSYNIGGSVVCCIKAIKKGCLTGTFDGKVLLFSRTGVLNKVFEAHRDAVTSIAIWNLRLITTSFDATLHSCNIEDKKEVKATNVGCPIICSRERKGILYMGSSTGHIIKYNVRAFTRLGNSVQVSTSSIRDIEILEMDQLTAIAVAPAGKPVSIRCAMTGSLLWNCAYMVDILSLAPLRGFSNYLCGINLHGNKIIRFKGGQEELVLKSRENTGGHILVEYEGVLYYAGTDGNIYIYGGKDPAVFQLFGTGEKITGLSVDKKRVIFSTCTTVTHIALKDEKN